MKLLALSASPKRGGRTEQYLERFVRAAKQHGAAVRVVRLYDHPLPIFSGRLTHARASNKITRLPKLGSLLKALRDCDGFYIATPTHWFNLPGPLKNLVDHLTVLEECGYFLEGKVVGCVAYGPQGGATDVLQNLALVLTNMGCVLPPYSLIWFGQKHDHWTLRDIDLLTKNMILQIQAQQTQRISWDYKK